MNKSDARHLIIKRLKADSSSVNGLLYRRLFALNAWKRSRTVSITLSTSIEIPTRPIIKKAWRDQKEVVVPKVKPERQMIFVPYRPDDHLVYDRFGILEPKDDHAVQPSFIDLMLVPGLAFTPEGARLGFGGGYYDRYLKHYNGFTVSLAKKTQLFNRPVWPVSKHDVRIDKIIGDEDVSGE